MPPIFLRRFFTIFFRRFDKRASRLRHLGCMKRKALLLLLLAFALLGRGGVRADGFIVIHQPVAVPSLRFAFAPLEVSYHHVNARIDGQICTTTVEEDFYNPNSQTLEGTYLFPIPKSAQIDKFTMEIGGKETTAELLPADKARAIYEDIVRREKDPALLEYADRGLFRVHVYPIEGNSHKRVRITYSEVLKMDSGLVSYTYPLNTEKFSSAPIHDVSVSVQLKSDQPITSIYSPTHDVEIKRDGSTHATVGYEAKNVRPETDFQLFFAPEKRDIALNLLAYRVGERDGYFMLLASPSLDAKVKRLPKDVVFVLDTSGSMAEDQKLVQAKKALQFCLANLNADDRFEVIRFSTEPEQLFGSLTGATPAAVEKANNFVKNLRPTGGTAIDDALKEAIALRSAKSERPYVVVFLTDGEPTVGETSEDAIVADTDKAAVSGTRIFCFGLGTDVNAHLLDRIAENTHATSDYVLPEEDIEVKVSSFFAKIREPVLSGVTLTFPDGVRVSKMYPQALPDLFKGQQLVLCGRYTGDGSGNCVIEGNANGVKQRFAVPVSFPKENLEQPFVPRLWASRRVAYLLDQIRLHGENPELKDEVSDLAREFGLVTPYTAYLIMQDEQQRNVAPGNQAMNDLENDSQAQARAGEAMSALSTPSGSDAVNMSRGQNEMKSAMQSQDSLEKSNISYARSLGMTASAAAALAVPADSSMPTPAAAEPAARLVQYTQRARFVGGRAFFLNGKEWVDGNLSTQKNANVTRLVFASDKYFAFVEQHPAAEPYLALGRNVKIALGNDEYDISEAVN
jgi:Ca-activated chloride channel family protein